MSVNDVMSSTLALFECVSWYDFIACNCI